jgi:hypothetical protein
MLGFPSNNFTVNFLRLGLFASFESACPFCRGLFSQGELYFTTRAARKGFGQWMDFIEGQKAKKTVQQAQKPKATGQGSRGQAHKNQ